MARRGGSGEDGGGDGDNDDVLVAGARSGGSRGGCDGSWTSSPAFCEQPLERKETPFVLSNDD